MKILKMPAFLSLLFLVGSIITGNTKLNLGSILITFFLSFILLLIVNYILGKFGIKF